MNFTWISLAQRSAISQSVLYFKTNAICLPLSFAFLMAIFGSAGCSNQYLSVTEEAVPIEVVGEREFFLDGGTSGEAIFELFNHGDSTLTLSPDVATSCGCTSGKLSATEIKPDGKIQLTLKYSYNGNPTAFLESTVFCTSLDKSLTIPLTVHYKIIAWAEPPAVHALIGKDAAIGAYQVRIQLSERVDGNSYHVDEKNKNLKSSSLTWQSPEVAIVTFELNPEMIERTLISELTIKSKATDASDEVTILKIPIYVTKVDSISVVPSSIELSDDQGAPLLVRTDFSSEVTIECDSSLLLVEKDMSHTVGTRLHGFIIVALSNNSSGLAETLATSINIAVRDINTNAVTYRKVEVGIRD